MKVGLCLLPYFGGQISTGLVPHLGLALLTAHLRRVGVDVTAIDLRPEAEHHASDHVSLLTEEKRFVSEVPALELLVHLLERFQAGCGLDGLLAVDHDSSELKRYAEERRLNPAAMLRSLDEVHRLVGSNIERLGAFDIIGFTAYMSNTYAVLLACAALRILTPTQTIIVGGPEVTQSEHTARLLLHTGLADAVIPGEALAATAAVIDAKRVGRSIEQVPGVMVLHGHQAHAAPAAPLPIGELPYPDFSDFDPDAYRRFSYPIATSLGCPFGCSFCSEKDLFGRYRRLSVDGALGHLQHLKRSHRCRHIYFGDSLLNVGDDWLPELADAMVEHEINSSWEGYLRAGSSRSSLRRLKRAGFSRAVVGIESVSDELLTMMNKTQASRTNLGTIEAFLDEGLAATLTFIVGFPGERAADHHQLIQLLERLSGHNREIERTLRAAYRTMGFRALPSPIVPDVGAFPLPFFLKPMSEIYASPRDVSLRVVPYGDRFSDRSLPDDVKKLIARIPRTFDSEREPTRDVYERMLGTTDVPGIDGRNGEFVQNVHTYFHGFSVGDRFAIRHPAVFETPAENGPDGLRYRSLKLGMEISCHGVAGSAVGRLRDGATLGELADNCTTGSRPAEVELRHFLAVAAVEESVEITVGE